MSAAKRRGPRRALRIGLQLLGFALGLALLAWCISGALSEANRAQLGKLRDASAAAVFGLVALCLASLACNGAIFWCALRPVRRINPVDIQATNAVGTFLAYAPFKLSVLFRVLIHTRRDGVPLLMVGGWFAAVAAGVTAATLPLVGASLMWPRVNALFIGGVLAGLVISHLLVWRLAACFAGPRGLGRVQRLADRVAPRAVSRWTRASSFANLHAAFDMLAHPGWLAAQMALRVLDLGLLTGRLVLVASMLAVPISVSQSIIYAFVHFALGMLSPTGALGTREGGAAGLASILDPEITAQLQLVFVVVLAVESVVTLAAAAAGLLRLRPDKLLRNPPPRAAPAAMATPEAAEGGAATDAGGAANAPRGV